MQSIDHALDTYCRHVMTEMGADTTSTSALDHYGRTHFPAHFFAGVYPADREYHHDLYRHGNRHRLR